MSPKATTTPSESTNYVVQQPPKIPAMSSKSKSKAKITEKDVGKEVNESNLIPLSGQDILPLGPGQKDVEGPD